MQRGLSFPLLLAAALLISGCSTGSSQSAGSSQSGITLLKADATSYSQKFCDAIETSSTTCQVQNFLVTESGNGATVTYSVLNNENNADGLKMKIDVECKYDLNNDGYSRVSGTQHTAVSGSGVSPIENTIDITSKESLSCPFSQASTVGASPKPDWVHKPIAGEIAVPVRYLDKAGKDAYQITIAKPFTWIESAGGKSPKQGFRWIKIDLDLLILQTVKNKVSDLGFSLYEENITSEWDLSQKAKLERYWGDSTIDPWGALINVTNAGEEASGSLIFEAPDRQVRFTLVYTSLDTFIPVLWEISVP